MENNVYKVLFDWENLEEDEFNLLTDNLSIKKLRWLAMIHPDNKTRENLLRKSKIKVGNKTVINIGINLYNNEPNTIEIGKRCAIAANVGFIYESNSNMSLLGELEIVKNNYFNKGKIIIEDDVWIGANVLVFPGVTIKKGSIIGANSIVKKDTQPYGLYIGQPAKFIKTLKQ